MLSFAPGFTYYREPDNPDLVPGARWAFRWLYLPSGASDPAYAAHMTPALRHGLVTQSTMTEDRGPLLRWLPPQVAHPVAARLPSLYLRRRGILTKLTFSSLTLEWIAETFPHARQVHLIRHPCGTFASWRRLGWEPRPTRLLEDERLVADHLAPYARVLEQAEGFWERAGAEWAAVTLVVTRQAVAHPDWSLVPYEWLCLDPQPRFRAVLDALGVPFTRAGRRFLERSDRGGDRRMHSLRRAARQEVGRWQHELDPDDVRACRRVVEQFELPWYPGFGPLPIEPRLAPSPRAGNRPSAP